MNPSRDIALVDELRALPAETAGLEFKTSNIDPDHPQAGYVPHWA